LKLQPGNQKLLAWSYCLIAVTGLTTRLSLASLPLGPDDAWVANSVLAPSLKEMFFYPKWLQTTPPLFLLMARFLTFLGGSEWVLRLVPLLACVVSVVLMGMVLNKLFSPTLAIFGTLFLATNNWSIKYSEQVKQYTTDMLVSTLFVFFLFRYFDRPTRRNFSALILAGTVGIFLSYAAIFWFPVVVVAVIVISREDVDAASERREARQRSPEWAARVITAVVAYGLSLVLVDVFFIRGNRMPNLADWWITGFIGSGGLISSFGRFLVILCDLLAPQHGVPLARWISFALGMVVLGGLIRAAVQSIGGDRRARNLLIVSTLPVSVAIVVSALRQYPLLAPRMLIWTLPLCTVLLAYAAEPFWRFLIAKTGELQSTATTLAITVLICGLIMAVYLGRSHSSGMDGRSAVALLKRNVEPGDLIFVRGGTEEQFAYYTGLQGWRPPSHFIGNTNLPCCLRTPQVVGPRLEEMGFANDIHSFAQIATGNRAWFFLYAAAYQRMQEKIQAEMSSAGCRNAAKTDFENLTVALFDCKSAALAPGMRSSKQGLP
jgi:hypothetical protein